MLLVHAAAASFTCLLLGQLNVPQQLTSQSTAVQLHSRIIAACVSMPLAAVCCLLQSTHHISSHQVNGLLLHELNY